VLSSDTGHTPFDVGAKPRAPLPCRARRRGARRARWRSRSARWPRASSAARPKAVARGRPLRGPGRAEITLCRIGEITLYERDQHRSGPASAISHCSPPPFAAQLRQVAVDTETGLVRCCATWWRATAGGPIHAEAPPEGQVEGAVANASLRADRALRRRRARARAQRQPERYRHLLRRGHAGADHILVPTVEPTGAYGAKSVSEINITARRGHRQRHLRRAGVRLAHTPFTRTCARGARREGELSGGVPRDPASGRSPVLARKRDDTGTGPLLQECS